MSLIFIAVWVALFWSFYPQKIQMCHFYMCFLNQIHIGYFSKSPLSDWSFEGFNFEQIDWPLLERITVTITSINIKLLYDVSFCHFRKAPYSKPFNSSMKGHIPKKNFQQQKSELNIRPAVWKKPNLFTLGLISSPIVTCVIAYRQIVFSKKKIVELFGIMDKLKKLSKKAQTSAKAQRENHIRTPRGHLYQGIIKDPWKEKKQ